MCKSTSNQQEFLNDERFLDPSDKSETAPQILDFREV